MTNKLPCSPYFDRFDISEAHYVFENDWHNGGWLQERESNQRRREATHIQLDRLRFSPSHMHDGWESLSINGKEIYVNLVAKYFTQYLEEYMEKLELAYEEEEADDFYCE